MGRSICTLHTHPYMGSTAGDDGKTHTEMQMVAAPVVGSLRE